MIHPSDTHARRRPALLTILAILLLVSLALVTTLAWSAAQLWLRLEHYPSAAPLPDLNGIRITITGLGRCLTLDAHLWARADVTDVSRWYEANGWIPLAPLVPKWRIGRVSFGRFVYLEPLGRGATQILQRQAVCVQA